MSVAQADFVNAHEGNTVQFSSFYTSSQIDPVLSTEPATKHYVDAQSINGAGYMTTTTTVNFGQNGTASNIWRLLTGLTVPITYTKIGNMVTIQVTGVPPTTAVANGNVTFPNGVIPAAYRTTGSNMSGTCIICKNGVQSTYKVDTLSNGYIYMRGYTSSTFHIGDVISFNTFCIQYIVGFP